MALFAIGDLHLSFAVDKPMSAVSYTHLDVYKRQSQEGQGDVY